MKLLTMHMKIYNMIYKRPDNIRSPFSDFEFKDYFSRNCLEYRAVARSIGQINRNVERNVLIPLKDKLTRRFYELDFSKKQLIMAYEKLETI